MTQRRQASRKTLVDDARGVVRACAAINARLAARRITGFMEAHMRGANLSIAQFTLMIHLAAAENDTVGAIAERSGLDQSTVSRNLRKLERAGLVEITIVEKDLRRRAVWLTEKGARRLETSIPVWRGAHEALCKIIPPGLVRKIAASSSAVGDGSAVTAGR
jgi:DNA-binding MarR family transcriptional regulator